MKSLFQKYSLVKCKDFSMRHLELLLKYLYIHSLKQLIFSLVLFFSLFSFAGEENNAVFYVNQNTTIVGTDYIVLNKKLPEQEKKESTFYIVEHTIVYGVQYLPIVIIKNNSVKNKKSQVLETLVVKNVDEVLELQSKAQVTQTPFPDSLPIEKTQTIITSTTITVTSSVYSKEISKTFVIHNYFSFPIRKALSKKQNIICDNQNSKPFQIKIKYCNRPPPVLYC